MKLLMLPLRIVCVLGLALLCGLAPATGLTLEQANNPNGFVSASLSPDGKHIAAIAFTGTSTGLYLIDTDTLKSRLLVGPRYIEDGYRLALQLPVKAIWAGNDLLAVDFQGSAESVNLKGKRIAELGAEVLGNAKPERPDLPWLLVYRDKDHTEMALVNARTGEKKRFRYPMSGKPVQWAFDKEGELRAMSLVDSEFWNDVSRISNWYRASASAPWEKLAEFGIADEYWLPKFALDAPDTLAIYSRIGRDTYALFEYDTRTRKIGAMMAGHPSQDILDVEGFSQETFKVVITGGMLPQYYWFDPAWGRLQKTVDSILPGRINQISGNPATRVLIRSYGDVDPGTWYLLDVPASTMREVLRSREGVDRKQALRMRSISYQAGDGLTIPAFLTLPELSAGPAPTVILIHGGPQVRDRWQWNQEVQILAANGYVVLQPQFRGSSGFGRAFEQAGRGQWGLAMQDDITAGVAYLISQGIADPQRICIYGASYGGYAALWGLAKTPELYRCGISFAGVSDIGYMLSDRSDSNNNKVTREWMRSQFGVVNQNKEQFDLVSPLKHADRIKVPLLLMHGALDQRVPISHSNKMMRALDLNGKTYQWQEFPDEGHGITYLRNNLVYFDTLLAFLMKNIGAGKPGPATVKANAAAE